MQGTATLYSNMLQVQCGITFEQELPVYNASKEWSEAKEVLDIGCGNGDYLSKLRESFPDKVYTGVDISQDLVTLASERHPQIKFMGGSFAETVKKTFDVIILRLILNTIPDRAKFFSELKALCHDRTWIVIADSEDTHFRITPELPDFIRSLQTLRTNASSNGATRKLRQAVPLELAKIGFQKTEDTDYAVTSAETGKTTMRRYMSVTADLSCRDDWKDAREKDLERWESHPEGFASFGLFVQTYRMVST